MSEKYERVVEKFMESWSHMKETEAVIICGSYVTGRPSKHSDIDLQIILSDKINWRERGNKIIDGMLIEYFCNPKKQIKKYFVKEFNGRLQHTAHMIFTGKILFDKNGLGKKLKIEAGKYLSRKYSRADKDKIEQMKYHFWDMQDNLEEIYENGEGFDFGYYVYLKKIFDDYSEAIGYSDVPTNKILKFLSSEEDRKKYMVEDFPDKEFREMMLKALKEKKKEKMMVIFREINEYVIRKLGGFELDGWKFKSKLK
jgi:hypothetical protein